MQKILTGLMQQVGGVTASVARIDENCKHIKESMDSLHTGEKNAAITLPNCPTVGILRTLVRNLLSRLISPSISEEIHCTGKGRPYVFKNSRLHGFLLNQVCQRPGFATVAANAVNAEARLWFKLRRERTKTQNPQAINFTPGNECDKTDEGEEESSVEDREQGERYNKTL
ncbi:unnamed protein product [Calicophoron daubneyi]|uniref:Uncharacterized protein n=1 Tax=Calicophoron daubneyi TaxID=300641 RepID=A0AAV2TAK6_CALDB